MFACSFLSAACHAIITPGELLKKTTSESMDAAFISLLPEEKRRGHRDVTIPPLVGRESAEIAIEATGLTIRFGNLVAVDRVNFVQPQQMLCRAPRIPDL